jgi:hypothetical protein
VQVLHQVHVTDLLPQELCSVTELLFSPAGFAFNSLRNMQKYDSVPLRRLVRRRITYHDTSPIQFLSGTSATTWSLWTLSQRHLPPLLHAANLHIADMSALSLFSLLHISRMRLNLPFGSKLRSTAYVMMPCVVFTIANKSILGNNICMGCLNSPQIPTEPVG